MNNYLVKLDELYPLVRPFFYDFISLLEEEKIDFQILEVYRPQINQDALYAQGREPLEVVNSLRAKAGLYLIDEAENKIVTNAKNSVHTERRAMDVVPIIRVVNEKGRQINQIPWNLNAAGALALWERIVETGIRCGLEAGARWKDFPDWPHYQKII